MPKLMNFKLTAKVAVPALAALALAACGSQDGETVYETDVVDQSGGELIVIEEDPDAVSVNVPETTMTSVPNEPVSNEADPAAQ